MRLYLQVMLIIDLGAYLTDLVLFLFLTDLKTPELPLSSAIIRGSVTAVLAAGWSFARFAKPGRLTLIALESSVTVGLVLVYIHLGLTYFSRVLPALP